LAAHNLSAADIPADYGDGIKVENKKLEKYGNQNFVPV
jgi:hypothetical protein